MTTNPETSSTELEAGEVLAECQAIDPRLVELAANRVANRKLAARVAELEARSD